MATTGLTTFGKYELFSFGWTTQVAWARLYTDSDVLVDEQEITLAHTAGTSTMQPTADIVFDVDAGTDDVSYIIIGYTSAFPLDVEFYTKTFASLYDFATAGTLTIDSFVITIGGSSILTAGKDSLMTTGLEVITYAKLYTAADELLDTQSVTFDTSSSTGVMAVTAPIGFTVTSGTAAYIMLGYGTTDVLKKTFDTPYEFLTAGTLTASTWEISI